MQESTLAGTENGLRLNLNLKQDDYIRDYKYNEPTAGFEIFVHDQREFPLVEQFGFVVQPGTHTYCSLRKKKVSKY